MKVSTENRRQIAQEIREILYQYHPRNRHIVTCTARDYNKYDTFYITSNTILDRFRSSLPNIEENPLFQSLLTYGFIKYKESLHHHDDGYTVSTHEIILSLMDETDIDEELCQEQIKLTRRQLLNYIKNHTRFPNKAFLLK